MRRVPVFQSAIMMTDGSKILYSLQQLESLVAAGTDCTIVYYYSNTILDNCSGKDGADACKGNATKDSEGIKAEGIFKKEALFYYTCSSFNSNFSSSSHQWSEI